MTPSVKYESKYITPKQGILLKNLGFNVECEWAYQNEKLVHDSRFKELKDWNKYAHVDCSAPELHIVVDWLSINYNLYAVALPLIKDKWIYCIYDLLEPFHMHKEEMKTAFSSSHEALSAAISFILNLSKKDDNNS